MRTHIESKHSTLSAIVHGATVIVTLNFDRSAGSYLEEEEREGWWWLSGECRGREWAEVTEKKTKEVDIELGL